MQSTEKQIKDIVIGDEIMSVHRDTAIITKEIVTSISSNLTERLIKIKDIYNEKIDYMNKYEFYPYIGELIQNTLKRQELLFETMLHVVEEIEKDRVEEAYKDK
jgi:hypothetical protein